jgi:hypothetical protein
MVLQESLVEGPVDPDENSKLCTATRMASRYKFGLKEYLIHLTVLEIERQEWGALSRMYV